MEEADIASFFCSGPRTGARGENVSPRTTGLQTVNNGQAFPQVETLFFFCFFMNEPVPGTPRHAYKTLPAIVRRSDYVEPASSDIYRQ